MLFFCVYTASCSLYGTREAAFVHSISAAGVAHAVTQACSSGQLQRCGCDRTVRGRDQEGFEWSGCSDNIAYGIAFSKAFVDAREWGKKRRHKPRSVMNIHNNEAGRRAQPGNRQLTSCDSPRGSFQHQDTTVPLLSLTPKGDNYTGVMSWEASIVTGLSPRSYVLGSQYYIRAARPGVMSWEASIVTGRSPRSYVLGSQYCNGPLAQELCLGKPVLYTGRSPRSYVLGSQYYNGPLAQELCLGKPVL
ncbi:hypothetical protein RRG08_052382 [Elysia crispata]|uniref:Protein Wnt n=1 Tax=Elysia crispata TaxID=231223 RepID=A0AAE1A706_9GAST|nr:hypothetical protein RRG08_052382 [Elysia crispata]